MQLASPIFSRSVAHSVLVLAVSVVVAAAAIVAAVAVVAVVVISIRVYGTHTHTWTRAFVRGSAATWAELSYSERERE